MIETPFGGPRANVSASSANTEDGGGVGQSALTKGMKCMSWNFHEAGGVSVDGDHRVDAVWHAAAGIMDGSRASLVCVPGVRFPLAYAAELPSPSSREGLPRDFGRVFVGYRRADYSGVGWLHPPEVPVKLLDESEERIVAVEAGQGVFVGTYVEHAGHGKDNWEERVRRVAATAKQVVDGRAPGTAGVWVCGRWTEGGFLSPCSRLRS